jgi:hypothetical protein
MSDNGNKYYRTSSRKKRQPKGVSIVKPKPAKAKIKLAMHILFAGWEDLPRKQLEARVHELRWLGAEYLFSEVEWRVLDKMRDKMRANTKFAVRTVAQ